MTAEASTGKTSAATPRPVLALAWVLSLAVASASVVFLSGMARPESAPPSTWPAWVVPGARIVLQTDYGMLTAAIDDAAYVAKGGRSVSWEKSQPVCEVVQVEAGWLYVKGAGVPLVAIPRERVASIRPAS